MTAPSPIWIRRSSSIRNMLNSYNHRGWAFYKKGDNGRAIADINEAVRLNPKYASARERSRIHSSGVWRRKSALTISTALRSTHIGAKKGLTARGPLQKRRGGKGPVTEAPGLLNAGMVKSGGFRYLPAAKSVNFRVFAYESWILKVR